MPSAIAQEFYEQLGPWYLADLETPGQPLLDLCEAFIGGLQIIEDVIRDDDDGNIGWSIVLDPDRAPASWLPWLSQFAGLADHDHRSLSEADFREHIKEKHVQKRGTPEAMIGAVQATLTGTKAVYLQERNGSAYQLKVSTYTTETPDAAKTLAAAKSQKPAGIVLTVAQISGGDYTTFASTHTNYNDVAATYISYAEIPIDPDK